MSALPSDLRGVIQACASCGAKNRLAWNRLGLAARCGKCQTEIPQPAAPVAASDSAHFDALVSHSRVPVLVDFWAAWCGPCRMVAPELERVAARNSGQLLIVKVDTEAVSDLAQRLMIQSIPTLAVYHHGALVARQAGAMMADGIEAFVSQSLAGANAAR